MSKRGRKKGYMESGVSDDVGEKAAPKHDAKAKQVAGTGPSKMLNNRKIIYAVILVVAVSLVAWRLSTFTLPAGTTTDITGQVVQQGTEPASQLGDIVKAGKNVKVEYTGKLLDGEEFDSGDIEFVVGSGQMIEGFDEAVVGMRVGEEKTATLPPEKAYGARDPTRVMTMPVVFAMERDLNITNEQFEGAFGEQPEVGKTYEAENVLLPLIVIDVVGDTVFLKWTAEVGRLIPASMEPWDMGVVSVNETSITLERKATDGMKIQTVMGEKEVSVKDGEMTIDMNHELAGKTLVFTIKVLSVTEPPSQQQAPDLGIPKSDKPKVDVFIMSYCPYGLQMQKAVLPVMELLGDKADITIKWVSYIMHGKTEIDENTRQYCIQLEQEDKYIAYAKCFTLSGNVESCLTEAGVDTAELDSCIAKADKEFNITGLYEGSGSSYPPYMIDADENARFGVGGSPTFVINGKTISVTRSPEAVKQAVCASFNNPPGECSQTLASSQASPGFGGNPGSDSDGSC